jgi:hypothetical protein
MEERKWQVLSLATYIHQFKELKMVRTLLLVIFILGCSNKQMYESIQENQRLDCYKLPQPQYETCMEELGESYEDYQRAREEAIGDR